MITSPTNLQPRRAHHPAGVRGVSSTQTAGSEATTALGLSPRALVLSLVLVVAFTAAGCFCVFLRYEIIGTGYLPRGAICVLLLVVLTNGLARRLARALSRREIGAGWGLTRREVLLVFLLLMVIGAVPGQEFAQHVYLNNLGIVHYTMPEIAPPHLYLDELNDVLVTTKNPDDVVIRWAYEGLPPGGEVPYRPWIRPLLMWTPFWFALYLVIACFAAVLAPRWEDEEKVLYPLVQVPVEVAGRSERYEKPLLRNAMLWVCFGLSTALYLVKGLHSYFPEVPDIKLQERLGTVVGGGPLVAYNGMPLHFYPEMVGIAYLLTAEVGFSLWFFYQLRIAESAVRNSLGLWTGHAQFFEFQTMGGYVVLGGALLWSARHHFVAVLRHAFAGGPEPGDGSKPQPYRPATYGLILGMAFIVWWCVRMGMSVQWALLQYLLFPLVSMVVARVICEAGMFIYSSPFRLNEAIFDIFGTQRIGARNVTLMTMCSWAQIRSTATMNMPAVFQGFKIGSMMELSRPQLLWAMLASIWVSILVCHVVSPYVIYNWSIPKLGWWPRGSSLGTTTRLASFIKNPTAMGGDEWVGLGGAGVGWRANTAPGGDATALRVVAVPPAGLCGVAGLAHRPLLAEHLHRLGAEVGGVALRRIRPVPPAPSGGLRADPGYLLCADALDRAPLHLGGAHGHHRVTISSSLHPFVLSSRPHSKCSTPRCTLSALSVVVGAQVCITGPPDWTSRSRLKPHDLPVGDPSTPNAANGTASSTSYVASDTVAAASQSLFHARPVSGRKRQGCRYSASMTAATELTAMA
jgi:hypothetical protein